MNGRFASLHGLKAQDYTFTLPSGATRVIDPETGKTLAEGAKEFIIHVQPQDTYWYLFE
jgi:GTPase involved in cell partitioning and DNA repair